MATTTQLPEQLGGATCAPEAPASWAAAVAHLSKDCGCTTHTGPHWTHMDAIDYRASQRLYDVLCAALKRFSAWQERNPGGRPQARDEAISGLRLRDAVGLAEHALAQAESARLQRLIAELERAGIHENKPARETGRII